MIAKEEEIMPRKCLCLSLALALLAMPVYSAQVLKVGSGGKVIAISHEASRKWQVGDEICVTHRNALEGCGTVSKVRKSGAIVNMEDGSPRIAKGDFVESKGNGGSSSASSGRSSSGSTTPTSFAMGFHGGPAFASLVSEPPPTTPYESKTGPAFGVTANLRLASWLYLQPELLYVSKGGTATTVLTTASVKYTYIELPLLLEFKFRFGNWMPFFQTGPFVGYNLGATSTSTVTATGNSTDTDQKNNTKAIEFGAYVGAGLDFLVGSKTSINLTLRYSLGLSNIDNTTTATSATSLKNRNFQALIGMNFWF